jgi:hypothetical protein
MKKKLTILCTLLTLAFSTNSFGQIPQRMSYQSVIRNAEGNLVVNAAIGIQISILKDTPTGQAVYVETMNNTTNENGLLSLEIGGGTPVLGSFSQINWATGTYFVKTETDPTGGTNYTIVGTGQLLSVPYALYAGSSKNIGKTTIILTDEITNEEAAAVIAAQAGPNTENVIISGTNQLTTLDLSVLTSLITLDISDNPNLTSVLLSNVSKIHKEVTIDGNPQLATINLDALTIVPKKMRITGNGITTLNLPLVTKVAVFSDFVISSNPSLININLPLLQSMGENATLTVSENIQLSSLSAPILQNGSVFQISENSNLQTINFGSLTQVQGINLANNKLIALSFPNLASGAISISDSHTTSIEMPLLSQPTALEISNTNVTALSFPAVTSCDGIYIEENALLTSVNLSSLVTAAATIRLISNPLLTSINLTALAVLNPQNLNYSYYFDCSDNALPESQINTLLSKLTTVNPASGKTIDLSNQNPLAPPTGQGLIDKQTLIDSGFNVVTD